MITWVNQDDRNIIGEVDYKPAFKLVCYGQGDWSAYFRPKGWSNFGESCRAGRAYYRTAQDAVADCLEHLEKFGANPAEVCELEITATTLRRPY